jgi:hypothetical protein
MDAKFRTDQIHDILRSLFLTDAFIATTLAKLANRHEFDQSESIAWLDIFNKVRHKKGGLIPKEASTALAHGS